MLNAFASGRLSGTQPNYSNPPKRAVAAAESYGLKWLRKQVSPKMLQRPFLVLINGVDFTGTFVNSAALCEHVTHEARSSRVHVCFRKQVRPSTKHTRAKFRYAGIVSV